MYVHVFGGMGVVEEWEWTISFPLHLSIFILSPKLCMSHFLAPWALPFNLPLPFSHWQLGFLQKFLPCFHLLLACALLDDSPTSAALPLHPNASHSNSVSQLIHQHESKAINWLLIHFSLSWLSSTLHPWLLPLFLVRFLCPSPHPSPFVLSFPLGFLHSQPPTPELNLLQDFLWALCQLIWSRNSTPVGTANKMESIEFQQMGEGAMAAQDRLKTFGDNDLDIQNCDKAEVMMMRFAVSKLWCYRPIKCQRKAGNWEFLCWKFKGGQSCQRGCSLLPLVLHQDYRMRDGMHHK